MPEKPKFYITTAIAYTSRKPHIGNSYEVVLTDAIARYKRMRGFDVFFLTGTDEHGQKIEACAKEAGVEPKTYVDRVAGEIREICDLLNVSYDKFIRTTDDYHERAVAKIFEKLYRQGDIYKGEYEGLYCTPCESFWTESQLVGGKCPDCGREVKKAKEEAYFFRLSKYQKPLEDYIGNHPGFIYPEARKKEMLNNFIRPGLQDLCVSRSSFRWGVPVSFDKKHVVYVWIDALSNYITALGYDPAGSGSLYKKYWPADLHVIGKDIVRFHTIYWPALLMALGEPLPKKVYGHPWLLFGEDKMSKSKGNVIYADDLVRLFGADAVRYYLLSEMPVGSDGSITYEALIERYNSDLANTLGNLVKRAVTMQHKYFGGAVQPAEAEEAPDGEVRALAEKTAAEVDGCFSEYRLADAAACVMTLAHRLNKYIDETSPWTLAKDKGKRARLGTVLYTLLEGIRFLAVLLTPFMPETAEKIFVQLGADARDFGSLKHFGALREGTVVGGAEPLFDRIDGEKLISELTGKREAEKPAPGASELNIEDFARTDLRVAEVLSCEKIPRTKKLLRLTLDDGSGTPRTVASGIAEWYSPEDLTGRKVVVVANLKPAMLCGVESRGMILAAEYGDEVRVLFADGLPNGARIR